MSLYRAVALVDHDNARVLQFDADRVVKHKMYLHQTYRPESGGAARSQLEFFAEVCDAMDGIAKIFVVGAQQGLDEFRHHVETRRPLTASCIVGYAVVDRPSQEEMIALARSHFSTHDRAVGERRQDSE